MATPRFTESTVFSKDVLGRYICNGLDEAIASTDPNPHPELGASFRPPTPVRST